MDIYEIAITDIDMKESQTHCQIRGCTDSQVVEEYAAQMRLEVSFPPVTVFHDEADDKVWLVDGFHRVEACEEAGISKVKCHIYPGTLREAILYAVGANAKHGLRRSNDDKRRAVMVLLNDQAWSKWSDRKIAGQCGVSNHFVGDMRKRHCDPITVDEPRTYEREGEVRTMNVSNIGKAKDDEPAKTVDDDRPADSFNDLSPDRTETEEAPPVDPGDEDDDDSETVNDGANVLVFCRGLGTRIDQFAADLMPHQRLQIADYLRDVIEELERDEL